jgi:chitinase
LLCVSPIDVVVSLSEPSASVVRVSYATANGTAIGSGFDFVTASGTLNFAAGETTKTVRIQLTSDNRSENLEFFTFNLSGAANASIPAGLGTTTIWIVDNDTVVDTPSVFVQDIVVDEKIGAAEFIVRLGNDSLGQSSNSTITVDYTTSNGSATAGSDFVGKSGTLTFAPGETVKTVAIDIIDDTLAEGQEFFGLNLSNAVNVSIVHGNALARIGANDSSPVSQPNLSVAKDLVVNESAGYID